MLFEYLYTTTAQDSIDIEDIGNTALYAATDVGKEYYLIITTELGFTTIEKFGPLNCDSKVLPNNFYYSYNRFDYSEKTICKFIKKFIEQDNITQLFEFDIDDAEEVLKSLEK